MTPDPANPPPPSASGAESSAPGAAAAFPPPKQVPPAVRAAPVLVTVHGSAGSSLATRRRLAEILAPAAKGLLDPEGSDR